MSSSYFWACCFLIISGYSLTNRTQNLSPWNTGAAFEVYTFNKFWGSSLEKAQYIKPKNSTMTSLCWSSNISSLRELYTLCSERSPNQIWHVLNTFVCISCNVFVALQHRNKNTKKCMAVRSDDEWLLRRRGRWGRSSWRWWGGAGPPPDISAPPSHSA